MTNLYFYDHIYGLILAKIMLVVNILSCGLSPMQGLQNCEDNFVFYCTGQGVTDTHYCELYSCQTVLMAWASSHKYKKPVCFHYSYARIAP